MHAAMRIGEKMPSNCFLYMQVKARKFVRVDPAKGWICDKVPLYRNPDYK